MKPTALLVVAGIILAVVVVIAAELSPGTLVDVAPVEIGSIRQFVDERGITRLPETFLITMPYHGRIEGIDVVEGTEVRAGQSVARVVPIDLELSVEQATAVVERLEAALRENADSSLEQTALEQSRQFVESTQATVEAAREKLYTWSVQGFVTRKGHGRWRRLQRYRPLDRVFQLPDVPRPAVGFKTAHRFRRNPHYEFSRLFRIPAQE